MKSVSILHELNMSLNLIRVLAGSGNKRCGLQESWTREEPVGVGTSAWIPEKVKFYLKTSLRLL